MRTRRTAVAVVATVAALAVTGAVTGCDRPTTHHRPGTSHDVATEPPPYDSYGNPVTP